MAHVHIGSVSIRGVLCTLPGDPVDVSTLGSEFGTDEIEKIKKTVGLATVHRVRNGQTAGDLCIAAAERLLDRLQWSRESIDGVIVVTQNPDHHLPATACVAHGRLGLPSSCLAFDVSLGCSGYVYGLWLASQAVASGACKRFLLLAGDTISRITSPEDRSVALLFGDAGSATALEFDASAERMSFVLSSDGSGVPNLIVPAGGFRQRPTSQTQVRAKDAAGNSRSPSDLYMDGMAIFNFTLQRVPELVTQLLETHGWEKGQVDKYLMHQANGFILAKIAKKLGLPAERVPTNIDRVGNTSVASIPLLIAHAIGEKQNGAPPLRVVMAGFGVGYSWAGGALTLNAPLLAQVVQV